MRTIKVTGAGRLKLKPDLTRIIITLSGKPGEYADTLRRSSEDTETLRGMFRGLGFADTDLKTVNFSVDPEYEGFEENGVYKQRFTGYRFTHSMKIEFGSDNEMLGRILCALAKSPVDPEFRIVYSVKDPERSKKELLSRAVSDSAEKAAVLADAAGVTLRDIQSIDYSWGDTSFESRPLNRVMAAGFKAAVNEESFDMNIEPEDISVSDTVTVIWEIA